MSNDLISRSALKTAIENLVVGGAEGLKDYYEKGSKSDENSWIGGIYDAWELINNAPTVSIDWGAVDGDRTVYARPQGECKTCRYYHPYCKQFSDEPRGNGYCVIARMTPEGMTTINCNDEFGCSYYQKGGAE